uniref:Uncharacterized protein n=1 Tax=Glossina brevipalpis TaxID=37001 RepID=A0A1A9WXR0_9MUSC
MSAKCQTLDMDNSTGLSLSPISHKEKFTQINMDSCLMIKIVYIEKRKEEEETTLDVVLAHNLLVLYQIKKQYSQAKVTVVSCFYGINTKPVLIDYDDDDHGDDDDDDDDDAVASYCCYCTGILITLASLSLNFV